MATVKYVQANGDTVTWKFKVCGDDSRSCDGSKVVFTIPTGVSLTGPSVSGSSAINVPKGSYNPSSTTWFIGTLGAGECTSEVDFVFAVDDITEADVIDDNFIISADLSSRCTPESTTADNDLELSIVVGEQCIDVNLYVGASFPSEDSCDT